MNASARSLVAAALLAVVLPVLAQPIPVTTPRLPPHGGGPGAAAPAQAQPQANMQPAAQPGGYGAGQAGRPAPGQAGMQAGAYANPAQQGQSYGAYAAVPAEAPVMPQRAEAGVCRAQPTPDRQTLMLVSGTPALARAHVPLGEFRAQQVVHSPDGRWAVAYTKLRGVAQYAAMMIDLERCEVQRVVDLSAAGEDVRFDGDDAVLRLADGERRIGLRDGRVR